MKNALSAAAITTLAGFMFVLGELSGLAGYKWWILRHYGWTLAGVAGVTFVVLAGVFHRLSLILPLRHTGQKLTHVDRQLSSPDAVFEDLTIPPAAE